MKTGKGLLMQKQDPEDMDAALKTGSKNLKRNPEIKTSRYP